MIRTTTNEEIIGNEFGGILCYSDVPAHLENGGYYISNGSCLLRYVPDTVHIKNMLTKARIDTARQIFDRLESKDLLSMRKVYGLDYIIQEYKAIKKEFLNEELK